ncbi:MAG: penicillin-binding protein A [Acidimicrobiia bacterium]|nr:MAG: penicillin-binding protein A [Acidimicrobiia bacterium]
MNRPIRRVGLTVLVLFVALVAQLTYLQVVRANDLRNHPGNVRVFLRDINRARGAILSSDGVVLAESVPSADPDDEIRQQRVYPDETAELFAHIVGYQSVNRGNSGVEATYNDQLVGRDVDRLFDLDDLADFFTDEDTRGNVVLTVSRAAQQLAADGLRGRRGSVVVLDVRTGGIVAAYSNPTYDPNLVATHDVEQAEEVFGLLAASPDNPALARAWRERYAPGSTFKVVTSGIALEAELTPRPPSPPGPPYRLTPTSPVYPRIRSLDLPQTDRTLSNFGGSVCGGDLIESFRRSCNTTFGQIGLDLGPLLGEGIERFGISTDPPRTDLHPAVVRSIGPEPEEFRENQPLFAQAAIGQGTVAVTPLAMAMVAQAVANGGVMLVPHVLDHVENGDGEVVPNSSFGIREMGRAMDPATAATVTQLMVEVVNNGTGTAAQIPGVQVAGKTGTAQVQGEDAHAWFVGFAPAEAPVYAIAVLVENGGDLGSEATGGRVAAPIARDVLAGLLAGG